MLASQIQEKNNSAQETLNFSIPKSMEQYVFHSPPQDNGEIRYH